MKVGLSMLLGLVLNYGILAPRLIEAKIVEHDPPKLLAVAVPKLPLEFKAGQSLAVQLDEAGSGPELPSPEALKADPQLSSTVNTQVFRYTWKRDTRYVDLGGLERDLGGETLQDGSPNPFHGVLRASEALNKVKVKNKPEGEDVRSLVIEAPAAVQWEARLSLPADQPAETLEALGFKLGADAEEAEVKQAMDSQKEAAMREVGGFRNISKWSLWPGATVLVVGGLLALAFQWRTLGRTFASIFIAFGSKRNAPRGPLDHIEIPMTWFVLGFLSSGSLAAVLLTWVFAIQWWMGAIAVVMTFFLAAVASRAGAETGINPIGALGKVTQLTYGALAPGNITANLMTAGITAGAACSCSDTVGNLKVGHMVGANPRRQFVAQLFGVLAGACWRCRPISCSCPTSMCWEATSSRRPPR